MRATLKDERGKVLIDVLGERDDVADTFSAELGDLIADQDETGELEIPAHATWTVVVSS
jgi:hypothetical protein